MSGKREREEGGRERGRERERERGRREKEDMMFLCNVGVRISYIVCPSIVVCNHSKIEAVYREREQYIIVVVCTMKEKRDDNTYRQ